MRTFGRSTYGTGTYAGLPSEPASPLPTRAIVQGQATRARVAAGGSAASVVPATPTRADVAATGLRAQVQATGSSAIVKPNAVTFATVPQNPRTKAVIRHG